MKQGLSLRVSQHLALTPQLQQSIRLLQLSTLELGQEIQQMLDDNPFLDVQAEEAGEEFGIGASDAPRVADEPEGEGSFESTPAATPAETPSSAAADAEPGEFGGIDVAVVVVGAPGGSVAAPLAVVRNHFGAAVPVPAGRFVVDAHGQIGRAHV